MADSPSQQTNSQSNQSNEAPQPEMLTPREDAAAIAATGASTPESSKKFKIPKRGRYRLSHRATFVGAVVVLAILALNGLILGFILRSQSESEASLNEDQVTISADVLNRLGINRDSISDEGIELVVGPNARFNKHVEIGGDVSVGGQLTLNNTFSAPQANFDNLQAGNVAVEQLNVNGDGTVSNLVARNDLSVAGTTRLQGPVTIGDLTSIENSLSVAGNLTVGGSLAINSFSANNLVVANSFTVGGHIISSGSAPSVSAGPNIGSNGTVSISGNDIAGTVAINAGTGAGGGIVANISFRNSFGATPHVVVTPIGNVGSFYIFRNSGGFSIAVSGALAPGGYAFDYIVIQ